MRSKYKCYVLQTHQRRNREQAEGRAERAVDIGAWASFDWSISQNLVADIVAECGATHTDCRARKGGHPMWDIRAVGSLMIVFVILFLLGLTSCRDTTEQTPIEDTRSPIIRLPDAIEQTHLSHIFRLSWFETPFNEMSLGSDFDRLTLHSDGRVEHWQVNAHSYARPVGLGQLTKEQQEKIRAILRSMTETHPPEPSEGSRVITLSFLWRGEYQVFSFNESSCSAELSCLLDIVGTALGWAREDAGVSCNPCQGSTEDQVQMQEPTLQGRTPALPLDLPDPVAQYHNGHRMFCITWFESPFDGSYDELYLLVDNTVVNRQIVDHDDHEAARGSLKEGEREEVQAALSLIANMSSIEQPVETATAIITLSFPWEADYHLFTFGDLVCPDSARRLFEIADAAFKRDSPGFEGFQNPCRE
jgi:hypothetical protein